MWVTDFLERLGTTSTLDDVQTLVAGLRDTLGVEHAIYHQVGITGGEQGAFTYDPEWVAHYRAEKYFHVDPAVMAVIRSTGPVDWRALDWKSPAARRLLGEAVSEGVGKQGLSVPLRGVAGQLAMFSVTSYDTEAGWDRMLISHRHNLVLAGHYIHQRVSEILDVDSAVALPDLTPRERDVLSYLSIGKSRAETAGALGISEHTLRTYLDTARLKLGAQNTTHAVALAMTRGLIVP